MGTKEFHISTTRELIALKDRVRNLINHWGEDGRYKEAVLKSIIQRFLPGNVNIASGFVVKQTNIRGEHTPSTQIDLIIFDTRFPVLFRESDCVIVTPDSVRGIIEVKANLQNQDLATVAEKANCAGQFIVSGKSDKVQPFFNGIFSYEGFERLKHNKTIEDAISKADAPYKADPHYSKFKVNHISFNKDLLYKYWEEQLPPNYLYEIEDLSFSFLIANLLDYLSGNSVIENSNLWFPVDKSIQVRSTF